MKSRGGYRKSRQRTQERYVSQVTRCGKMSKSNEIATFLVGRPDATYGPHQLRASVFHPWTLVHRSPVPLFLRHSTLVPSTKYNLSVMPCLKFQSRGLLFVPSVVSTFRSLKKIFVLLDLVFVTKSPGSRLWVDTGFVALRTSCPREN